MRTGRRPLKIQVGSILARLAAVVFLLAIAASCGGVPGPDPALQAVSTPLFTFVFDDGYDTDYLIGKDIFAERGVVACSAITTDWINTPRYLSSGQIQGLRDAGWEIMSHTATHPNLKWIDAAQVEDELHRSQAALAAIGISVRNLVYPYNMRNDQVRRITSKYYRSGRGGTNQFNRPGADPYDLRSFTSRQNLTKLKRAIDRANAEHAWMIIYHHEIDMKITLADKKGAFIRGEELVFSPSGAVGRHVRDSWFLTAGSMHLAPLAGTPLPGDRVTGSASRASAMLQRVVFNEREMIGELLQHVQTNWPGMRIVTIDQGLNIIGVPEQNR